MFRYIAALWLPRSNSDTEAAGVIERHLLGQQAGWQKVFCAEGMSVYCTGDQPVARLSGGAGVVLGTLFEWPRPGHETPKRALHINQASTQRIFASKGESLLSEYWGNYVALATDTSSQTRFALRSPTGNLPCHISRFCGITLVFSYIPDAVRLPGFRYSINGSRIQARVTHGWLAAGLDLLDGISELLGGERLKLQESDSKRDLCWSPSTVASRVDIAALENHIESAKLLRDTTRACTRALASDYDHTLHRLSGGLDSSIVFSALEGPSPASPLTCVNYFIPDGRSDERPFARLAARAKRITLIEQARTAQIDLRRILDTRPTAAPALLSPYIEIGDFERSFSEGKGRVGRFSGIGGDSVFGRTSARFAATDYARRHGCDRRLLSVSAIVARMTGQSFWNVLASAVRDRRGNATTDRSTYRDRARRTFASRGAGDDCSISSEFIGPAHPWFMEHPTLPSVVYRLGSLVDTQPYYNPLSDPGEADPEPVFPLFAQPLVELCLQIPTYVHNFDGRDRGLARLAFAGDIPATVLGRQWKDRAPGFFEDMFRSNASFLQELLMDGNLQQLGLLDRDKLEAVFTSGLTRFTQFLPELLDHACVEAWYQSLSNPPQHAGT